MKTLSLGDLNPETFLRDYWQKKPLLIRQAFPDIKSPLSRQELFALSAQDQVESRLVLEECGATRWQVEHAPFASKRFNELPNSNWSLLVQDVDKFNLAAATLLDHFQFIPNWRIDDLMISFAPDQGSVGPHRDEYDVFLIQAEGKRHWHISDSSTDSDIWIEDIDLNVLDNFHGTADWLLQPGDMLYLPPQLAHHGIAQGDCITLSVGFRSPTDFELFSAFSDHRYDTMNDQSRYTDASLAPTTQPGNIPTDTLETLEQRLMDATMGEETRIQHWLAQYLTEQKDNLFPDPPEQTLGTTEFVQHLMNARCLHRNLKTRMAWVQIDNDLTLYANGKAYSATHDTLALIEMLSSQRLYEVSYLKTWQSSTDAIAILTKLYNDGHLDFEF